MSRDDIQVNKDRDKEKGLGAKIIDKAKEIVGGREDKPRASGSGDYSSGEKSSWNPRMDEDYDIYEEWRVVIIY